MNLQYYYWWFKSAIPSRICDDIVNHGLRHPDDMALTGGFGRDRNIKHSPLNKKEIKNLKKKRDSSIVWMDDRWIYKEIQPYITTANKNAGWNFNWDWSESCQFTKYKPGQYYDWQKDYEGGELEFDFRNNDPHKKRNALICKDILPKGSLVVFPSFVWHRIKPVKKGTRYSLVVWNLGYPFR